MTLEYLFTVKFIVVRCYNLKQQKPVQMLQCEDHHQKTDSHLSSLRHLCQGFGSHLDGKATLVRCLYRNPVANNFLKSRILNNLVWKSNNSRWQSYRSLSVKLIDQSAPGIGMTSWVASMRSQRCNPTSFPGSLFNQGRQRRETLGTRLRWFPGSSLYLEVERGPWEPGCQCCGMRDASWSTRELT